MEKDTEAVHEGGVRDEATGAVTFPIYQTSTYGQETPGKPNRYMDRELNYGRGENPTRTALEGVLAQMEGGEYGLAFASGMAAVACVMNTLKSGDHVVACDDIYGGSYRQFTKVYAKLGIRFDFVDTTRQDSIAGRLRDDTALLWLETPSNPLIRITDIAAAAELAKSRGVRTVVDNTFATPMLQNPLSLGADVVLHSTTKYINGHADVLGGALVTNDEEIYKGFKFIQNACGFIPGPQDCFLVMRGVKTLGLRMERHCSNAKMIVEWLGRNPRVANVYYPGLEKHPGHEIAKRQMSDFGAMVSFELDGGYEAAKSMLERVRLITLAESLGAVQTLINHPASMTHASVEPDRRAEVGITDGLIRLSVGIESADDIIGDLEQAIG